MNSYLDKIVEYKRLELEAARRLIPIKDVRSMAEDSAPAIGFQKRFLASEAPSRIIAEVKKASNLEWLQSFAKQRSDCQSRRLRRKLLPLL